MNIFIGWVLFVIGYRPDYMQDYQSGVTAVSSSGMSVEQMDLLFMGLITFLGKISYFY